MIFSKLPLKNRESIENKAGAKQDGRGIGTISKKACAFELNCIRIFGQSKRLWGKQLRPEIAEGSKTGVIDFSKVLQRI